MNFYNGDNYKWIGVLSYAFYCRDITCTPTWGNENYGVTIGKWFFSFQRIKL